jgi:hypothetical protein
MLEMPVKAATTAAADRQRLGKRAELGFKLIEDRQAGGAVALDDNGAAYSPRDETDAVGEQRFPALHFGTGNEPFLIALPLHAGMLEVNCLLWTTLYPRSRQAMAAL